MDNICLDCKFCYFYVVDSCLGELNCCENYSQVDVYPDFAYDKE